MEDLSRALVGADLDGMRCGVVVSEFSVVDGSLVDELKTGYRRGKGLFGEEVGLDGSGKSEGNSRSRWSTSRGNQPDERIGRRGCCLGERGSQLFTMTSLLL